VASRKKRTQLRSMQTARQRQLQALSTEPFEQSRVVVPLIEEELKVNKSWAQAGEVVLRKVVSTSTEEVPVELGYEEVQVDRVAVNRELGEGETAGPRQDGDVWVIPVVREELVVLKRRVVTEEIRVTKHRATREETIREEVRREDLKVETAGDLNYLDNEGPQANPQ
jgi:uncharacterized protein (TIGR02271 family)